jgi:hypothetical protein
MSDLLQNQIGSIIRNLLALLGGFLIAHGVLNGSSTDFANSLTGPLTQLACGLLLWASAQVSSWLRNQKVADLHTALKTWETASNPKATALAHSDIIYNAAVVTGYKSALAVLCLAACLLSSCADTGEAAWANELGNFRSSVNTRRSLAAQHLEVQR